MRFYSLKMKIYVSACLYVQRERSFDTFSKHVSLCSCPSIVHVNLLFYRSIILVAVAVAIAAVVGRRQRWQREESRVRVKKLYFIDMIFDICTHANLMVYVTNAACPPFAIRHTL